MPRNRTNGVGARPGKRRLLALIRPAPLAVLGEREARDATKPTASGVHTTPARPEAQGG